MRIQEVFGKTLHDAPAEAELISHKLAVRAGLVRPLASGIYAWLPLGLRVLRRVERILREEMEAVGGQEVKMPVVLPAELWQPAGCWQGRFDGEPLKFDNHDGRHFVLGATHEEVVMALADHEVSSYRDLPRILFQIQARYHDTARPRDGLIRLREFTAKDAYSLDRDAAGLEDAYRRIVEAYLCVFARVGLSVIPLDADAGARGGAEGQEFSLLHPQGEDQAARCDHCDYAANSAIAEFIAPEGVSEAPAEMRKVATPDCKTIADVARFVGVETRQTLKAVFFMHNESAFVFAVIRGDLDVSEARLINALGGGCIRPATEDEIRAVGAEPGYASPIGLRVRAESGGEGIIVVADRSVQMGANFVVGANEAGYHLTGVNAPRDFAVTVIADIARAYDGAVCARCGEGRLQLEQVIELGHCFRLGARCSERIGVTYLDEAGQNRPVMMGSYSIGLDRLVAAIIEEHHDEQGIIWPRSVAPFDVHIVTLGKDRTYHERGRLLYEDLRRAGLEVLLDDRPERPGVKFADADLIGVPLRLTVSERALERETLEAKWRHSDERFDVSLEDAVQEVRYLTADR